MQREPQVDQPPGFWNSSSRAKGQGQDVIRQLVEPGPRGSQAHWSAVTGEVGGPEAVGRKVKNPVMRAATGR